MPDQPGPVATGRDTDFTLSIEDAAQLYANAGHPRTLRTLQRYCATGHLDCMKAATALGDKYFITPQSVARHIAQTVEMNELESRTTGRGESRPVATQVAAQLRHDSPRQGSGTGESVPPPVAASPMHVNADEPRQSATDAGVLSRQDATGREVAAPYVAQLETRLKEKDQVIDLLSTQLHAKDRQIEDLTERAKETNVLIGSLHRLLSPLLGSPKPTEPREHIIATEPNGEKPEREVA